MRVLLHPLMLAIVLITLGISFSTCHTQTQVKVNDPSAPNFPFTIVGQGGSVVFIAPEFYNQKNMESLFLWHYKKNLQKPGGAPTMIVFTDKEMMDVYLEARKKRFWESEIPDPLRSPSPLPTSKYSRNVFSAAVFSQVPSESMLLKGEAPSSSGFNVVYSFAPDLTQPKTQKKVVLRGSTWTEGKYNVETRELIWHTGRITVTAYDLYNVEPAGRYYTFGYKTKYLGSKGLSEKTRIIFNFRQDEAVLPPIDQVEILNESVAYLYMGWMFSVSLDGGQTWHCWDAERELSTWECCDPGLIQRVEIGLNGTGSMTLKPSSQRPDEVLTLTTKDYGQHWTR
jgi:hypothetical protein